MRNNRMAVALLSLLSIAGCSLLTQTTLADPPTATTLAASSLSMTNATINGSVNPNGFNTTAYFEYGLTTNYGNVGSFITLPATNGSITVPAFVVSYVTDPAGSAWTQTSGPGGAWSFITSSADGTRLAGVINGGGIWTSVDAGQTWTQTSAPIEPWVSLASSSDLTQLAAAVNGGGIWTSTNSGTNWIQSGAPVGPWVSVACSSDLTQLAAAVNGGGIWTSTNSGANWIQSGAPVEPWRCVASSMDGSHLAAAFGYSGIWTSTNGGATWSPDGTPSRHWNCIASSADGTELVAGYFGGIFTSTNSGQTLDPTGAPAKNWMSIACSADGKIVTANALRGGIWTSIDGGTNWAQAIDPDTNGNFVVTSSADGTRLAAANSGGTWISAGHAQTLAPGTICHYRLVSINSAGTSRGSDFSFATLPFVPAATTLPASLMTATSGTLNGTVNPGNGPAAFYFQYGLTTNYGSFSTTSTLPSTTNTLNVSNSIAGLTKATTYHYQLIASNASGTTFGNDLTFTTTTLAPVVTTLSSTDFTTTTTNATFNGTVNPNGLITIAYFEYGLTTNYGNIAGLTRLSGTNDFLVLTNLTGDLAPGTLYHYQLVASNRFGISLGGDQTLETTPTNPVVSTLAATDITASHATLNGTANPEGAETEVYFVYGLTTNYNNIGGYTLLPATNAILVSPGFVVSSIANSDGNSWTVAGVQNGLPPGTTYHYRFIGSNSIGTIFGDDQTFTTGPGAPAANTLNAGQVSSTNAMLHGLLTTGGLPTTAWFAYGLTTNYGNLTGTSLLAATNTPLTVSNWVSNLSTNSIYHYALVVSNSAGISLGNDFTLTTGSYAPFVTTLAATAVTGTSATLNGTVDPNGFMTTAYFEYGLTTNYGKFGPLNSLPALNTILTMPGLVINSVTGPVGNHWTKTGAPANNWYSLGSSADGSHLVAKAYYTGEIWISTDRGGSWNPFSIPKGNSWSSFSLSPDGTHLAALDSMGLGIWTSTNNGVDWIRTTAPKTNWNCIASSLDGTHLAAGVGLKYFQMYPPGPPDLVYGGIWISTDSGITWTQTAAPEEIWSFIASSAYGNHLAAIAEGNVWISHDAGANWKQIPYAFSSITISEDGTHLTALSFDYSIWTSSDSGETWTQATPVYSYFSPVAAAADGIHLAELDNYAGVVTSSDIGKTWTKITSPFDYYYSLASSADASQLVAANQFGGIYISSGAVNALVPGTTYHYQLLGLSSNGTGLGGDQTFTTSPGVPVATTLAANQVTSTNATLNGMLTTGGFASAAWFQFGFTTNYGSSTTPMQLAASDMPLSVSNRIGSLVPAAIYHYQLIVSNSAGISLGTDFTFTTPAQPPLVSTLAPTSVTSSNATLHGSVNPGNALTTAYFEFGLTTNYGNIVDLTSLPATNNTFTIPDFVVGSISDPAGAVWTQTSAPLTNWYSMASSGDGVKLAALGADGIWTSTNGGVNWNQTTAPLTNGQSIASSADGTHLAAVANNGGIWTSTNGGVTWSQTSAPQTNWNLIASSADGSHLAAVLSYGGIWTSGDNGQTWNQSYPFGIPWSSIASSADGNRLVVAGGGLNLINSIDGGMTWGGISLPITNVIFDWHSAAYSADGTHLALSGGPSSGIWISPDNGVTWAEANTSRRGWFSVALSANGTRLAAVHNSTIWTSIDAGVTWNVTPAPYESWQSIVSSYDGSRLAAFATNGGIYTSSGKLTPLAAGTTYHYQLAAINISGTVSGGDQTFTTAPGSPIANTLAANPVKIARSTLNGTLTTGGLPTAAWFQFGLSTNYGSTTSPTLLAATNTPLNYSNSTDLLLPATTYHYQLVVSNKAGVSLGNDLTFTTPPLDPVVTTLSATDVTMSNATLHGTINPGSGFTTAYFEYGLTTNYGNIIQLTALPATNATLTLPGLVVSTITGPAGVTWAQSSAPSLDWRSVASSADGNQLAAVANNGGIWISTNGGGSWIPTSAPSTNSWTSIASSGDGTQLAAVEYYGGIWISRNGGGTWNLSSAPPTNWFSIASSVDGSRLAAANTQGVWTSTNSGTDWRVADYVGDICFAVASSADGTQLTALTVSGVFSSRDGGLTWTQSTLPLDEWEGIASSADGRRLVVCVYKGGILTSGDGGETWTQTSAPSAYWNSVASSVDGTQLFAGDVSGNLDASGDGGGTWSQVNTNGFGFFSLVSSADGSHLATVSAGGKIWTSKGPVIALAPGTTYHYQLVGINSEGTGFGGDQTFTTAGNPPPAVPFSLKTVNKLSGGLVHLSFTNRSGYGFTVLGTTNLAIPLINWTVIGPAVESPVGSGNYQFSDTQNTNSNTRYYRVRSP